MKVIFLDIDGVLNSAVYDRRRNESDGNIDKSRLSLLLQIVDETGAVIVLSTTWRCHWDPDEKKCDSIGQELNDIFTNTGLIIADKTPELGKRPEEIRSWLDMHTDVESFVILDDIFFGWDELQEHLVRTNYMIGRGLEERHVAAAVDILNHSRK